MNYPAFLSRGLSTFSGALEADCKVAIGAQMKRAGIHWNLKGAKRDRRPPLPPPLQTASKTSGKDVSAAGRRLTTVRP